RECHLYMRPVVRQLRGLPRGLLRVGEGVPRRALSLARHRGRRGGGRRPGGGELPHSPGRARRRRALLRSPPPPPRASQAAPAELYGEPGKILAIVSWIAAAAAR